MKSIYLLRHAKSDWSVSGQADRDRTLNERGHDAARRMAGLIEHAGFHPAQILCSPATRTRQTLEHVLDSLSDRPPVVIEDSLYLASERTILHVMAGLDDVMSSVMVIGHNPGMEAAARLLAGSGEAHAMKRLKRKFPTAALAVMAAEIRSWRDLSPGCATLKAFVRPKHIDSDMG